ncbi:MAG: class I SAM-dependent methyltransferase [Nostoc sp.]|uniref:class I SAM-dependent methyltransferase n=1 Tax=Nostoc sp. TaxID=1180 RepID=UPI002FF7BED7
MNILDQYIKSAPSPQNALDIFKSEWSSKLPAPLADFKAGSIPLFEDARIDWVSTKLGGIKGKTVLELGPLEAGHTYMLECLEAASILSIEANTRAYLKCLIIKEILELKKTRFLCGDFVEYLRNTLTKFDVCIASGVLYHMNNPAELIGLIAKCTDKIFIWTHYYDKKVISGNPNLRHKFVGSSKSNYDGFKHTLYRQEYEKALEWSGFCGGNASTSYWMSRDDILACLKYFGLKDIEVSFDAPDHPNGPSFALMAVR